jgi:type II secretory ATPase GspE/PulE/Tfp pilus assembly ATPase PilB-like protein
VTSGGTQAIDQVPVGQDDNRGTWTKRLGERLGQDESPTTAPGEVATTGHADDDIESLRDLASGAPVVRALNDLVEKAVEMRASDIHIEPFADRVRVRYRIDGVLVERDSPPRRLLAPMLSRLKIMGSIDISEKRRPQDGKIRFKGPMGTIELRVATIPTSGGNEDVVMRILAASKPRGPPASSFSGQASAAREALLGGAQEQLLADHDRGRATQTAGHVLVGDCRSRWHTFEYRQ